MQNKVFVNFSNHPSAGWGREQAEAASRYGQLIDVPFPAVEAKADEEAARHLAEQYVEQILNCHPAAVLCQGEFCLTFLVVSALKAQGITVLAACSERIVTERGNKKEVTFQFERFRKY